MSAKIHLEELKARTILLIKKIENEQK